MNETDDREWERSALLRSLIAQDVLRTPALIEAFEKVDRADFVIPELKSMAYADRPLPIGASQTISQPYTVAFMLELLQPHLNDTVLDLGSGSGWTTALLACISKHVDAVERIALLVEYARTNLSKYSFENITVHQAGNELGLPGKVFNRILVSCAADEIPLALLNQLAPGGIMVIPVRNSIFKVTKTEKSSIETEEYPGFVFVPLIQEY